MRRYAISGLALTVLVLGGCGSAPTRVGLDPDVEYVEPVASVVYTPPTTTIVPAPPTTTVITPAATAVVQTPGSVAAADPAIVPAPTEITTIPAHRRPPPWSPRPAPPLFLRRGRWSFPHRAPLWYLSRARS